MCIVESCDRQVKIKSSQMCGRCYQAARKRGEHVVAKRWTDSAGVRLTCQSPECHRPVKCKGLCTMHYQRKNSPLLSRQAFKTGPKPKWVLEDGSRAACFVDGCSGAVDSKGLCTKHYTRNSRYSDPLGPAPKLPECTRSGCSNPVRNSNGLCGSCNKSRWRYGLDAPTFLQMWLPENRACSNPNCNATTNLHIDHDHSCCETGWHEKKTKVSCGKCVRGWLCRSCNTSLGLMQEDPRRIEGLLRYLEGVRP